MEKREPEFCHSERSEESPDAFKSQIVSSNITTKNTSIMIKKQMYEAPATEVLELRLEDCVLTITSLNTDATYEGGDEDW